MKKKEQDQQEAIRTLSKLSATQTSSRGTPWVIPRKESEERDRNSRLLDPNYVETGPGPESQSTKNLEFLMLVLKWFIFAAIIGYGGYGILMAFLNA